MKELWMNYTSITRVSVKIFEKSLVWVFKMLSGAKSVVE